MRFLDQSLAQEIVNRTMRIIKRNINVMNNKGIIIGSGDKNRINSIHEGSLKVIESKSGFEISELEAVKLQGVKAGINLPINFHDEIVGVIGITGVPGEIRDYGELVKMAAEMILQQAVLTDEMQWDERLREELTSQLLHDIENLPSYYFDRVKRLGIDLDIPRVAIIIAVENPSKGYKWIHSQLEKDDLYVMDPDYMVLLKKVNIRDGKWEHSKTLNQLKKWAAGLEKHQQLRCTISVGNYYPTLKGISKSYREAIDATRVGSKLDPHKTIYFYEDYKMPVFIARANHLGIGDDIGPYFQQLKQHDKKGELVETIMAYVEENGDVNQISRRLFIHRNTLRYRLERITELTSKDPRKVKDLLELYLSILQSQLI